MNRKSIFTKDYVGFDSVSDIFRDVSEMLDSRFNPLAKGISPEFRGTLTLDVTYREEDVAESKLLKLTDDLEVSLDIDGFPEETHKTVPVFLFVPKREPNEEAEHYHIMLSKEKAIELRDWLDSYLRKYL